MPSANDAAGRAALSICEALLLALNERGVLPRDEIVGVLRDAAAAHENALGTQEELETHRAAAALINAILSGGSPGRRP